MDRQVPGELDKQIETTAHSFNISVLVPKFAALEQYPQFVVAGLVPHCCPV